MTLLATVIARGILASRPAAASAGRLYFDTTNSIMYRDNGSSWDSVEGTGGMTNPMTTQGDTIYGGASGTPTRLAGGTSAYVLTSNGATSAPSWQAAGAGSAGALVFLAAQTASASATLDFTTSISSTYDDYLFEGVDLVPATNAVNLNAVIGTGGGPTYDTGANYYIPGNAAAYRIASTVTNAAGYGQVSFSARLVGPQSTAQNKQMYGHATWHDGSTVQMATACGGLWAVTTAATAVRFSFSSGNITSGVIRVYGISKS